MPRKKSKMRTWLMLEVTRLALENSSPNHRLLEFGVGAFAVVQLAMLIVAPVKSAFEVNDRA